MVAILFALTLSGCNQSSKPVHHHVAKTELIAKKKKASEKAKAKVKTEKKKKQEAKAKADKQKQARLAAQQAAVNQQVQQQAQQNQQQAQQPQRAQTQQPNSQNNANAPQPPAGVDPSKWAEHDAYTSNGVLMRQWNDTGKYEGDPDVQYQTIKGQEAFNKAHGLD